MCSSFSAYSSWISWDRPRFSCSDCMCFSSPVLNKRQADRKCSSQSAASLHAACTWGQSQTCFYWKSGVRQLGESWLCSEQGEDWQGCPPCSNKHWHITVFSHASTEVSLDFVYSTYTTLLIRHRPLCVICAWLIIQVFLWQTGGGGSIFVTPEPRSGGKA